MEFLKKNWIWILVAVVGYRVISKEQAAVSKLTPDPKRVVVEVVQMNCIKAPCPQVYNIVSAGV